MTIADSNNELDNLWIEAQTKLKIFNEARRKQKKLFEKKFKELVDKGILKKNLETGAYDGKYSSFWYFFRSGYTGPIDLRNKDEIVHDKYFLEVAPLNTPKKSRDWWGLTTGPLTQPFIILSNWKCPQDSVLEALKECQEIYDMFMN